MALRATNMSRSRAEPAEEAFDRLFVQEYRRVVIIARRIVNDADEAEDVAQEVFASFHGRHDAAALFAPAWLHRAASHLALNAVRSRKRRSRREQTEGLAGVRIAPATISENPAVSAERAEQCRLVRSVLSHLPQRSAQVLALRYSGLAYAEIAAAMRCGPGDVGTMLRRAEAAFRKEYEREASQ